MPQKASEKKWCENFGLRKTKTRSLLFETLAGAKAPLAVPELLVLFARQKFFPNKTTLYREIEQLVSLGILAKVQLSSERVSYELAKDHHHHFICQSCERVTKLTFCETTIQTLEETLIKMGKTVTGHTFELFGLCENCH